MNDTTATLIFLAALACLLLLLLVITSRATEAPAAVTIDVTGALLTSPFGGPFLWLTLD